MKDVSYYLNNVLHFVNFSNQGYTSKTLYAACFKIS